MSKLATPTRWPSGTAENKAGEHPATPNVVPIRTDGSDPLDSFAPESDGTAPAPARKPFSPVAKVRTRSLIAFAACVAVGAVAAGAFFIRGRLTTSPPAQPVPLTGRATLNSRPDGAAVLIDGVARGVTPLQIELPAGPHDVIFRNDASERRITLKIENGVRLSENVDMPVAVAKVGALDVFSEPSGARVTVDGTAAGVTPLKLTNVSAARHTVVVSQGLTTINRSVEVAAGATASVFVSLAPQTSSATGTFAVESPLELRIIENGQLLGLSNAAPIVLNAGKHQLELVNEALELRLSRAITVAGGKSTRLAVPVPNGTLSVNAAPWAEVFVDGKSIGMTPLGAVSIPVGSHEIVWRHPQLGEKRRSVTVGAQTTTRVTMDLSR
jgi:hypothetical protein